MTQQDYNDYVNSVESFFTREGLQNLSQVDLEEESYFTSTPCECCRRRLGGDRYHCNGFRPTKLHEVSAERLGNLLLSTVLLLWSIIFNRKSFDNCLREVFQYQITLGTILEFEVCSDCLYYAEYGQLDDMTMMYLEEEETNV